MLTMAIVLAVIGPAYLAMGVITLSGLFDSAKKERQRSGKVSSYTTVTVLIFTTIWIAVPFVAIALIQAK